MIEIYVTNQTLRLYTPVIAADTLKYLTGVVYFADEGWDECKRRRGRAEIHLLFIR